MFTIVRHYRQSTCKNDYAKYLRSMYKFNPRPNSRLCQLRSVSTCCIYVYRYTSSTHGSRRVLERSFIKTTVRVRRTLNVYVYVRRGRAHIFVTNAPGNAYAVQNRCMVMTYTTSNSRSLVSNYCLPFSYPFV